MIGSATKAPDSSPDPTVVRLFALMLGGRATGCHIELHDVVFAVGESFEALKPDLRALWFGDRQQVHVDAWAELSQVDGYRVQLSREPGRPGPKLWFINIGGYQPGEFAEQHAYAFIAAASKTEVKQQARARLLPGRQEWHKDDLFEIDDCLAIDQVSGWHVELVADRQAGSPVVHNGYFPLPRAGKT